MADAPAPHAPDSPAAAWAEWRASLLDLGRAATTIDGYRKGLAWCPPAAWAGPWADLERPGLLAALRAADLRPDGTRWSPSARTRNRKAWASLQRTAAELGFGAAVLTDRDLRGSGYGSRERIFAPDEWERLCAACPCPAARLAFRGLAASAMRPGELCRSTIADLRGEGRRRRIELEKHKTAEKTGKARVVPIGRALAEVIAEAVGDRTSGPIWLAPGGGRGPRPG